jgi:hypothetical protein
MEGSEGQANRASADDGDFDFLSSHASNGTEYEDVDVDMGLYVKLEVREGCQVYTYSNSGELKSTAPTEQSLS